MAESTDTVEPEANETADGVPSTTGVLVPPPPPQSASVSADEHGGADADDDDDDELSAPVPKHFTAPALIMLERVDVDDTFRCRSGEDDISALATDIARLGQLFPIDVRLMPPDRFQIISGFRRVAALRFLHREKVLARLHTDLSDDDAMLMALAAAIHSKSVTKAELEETRERMSSRSRLSSATRDMFEKALADESTLAPENVEEEVDADELAADVTVRLGQCNQDLSLLADVFADLDDERREALLTQLKYSIDLVAFLERES